MKRLSELMRLVPAILLMTVLASCAEGNNDGGGTSEYFHHEGHSYVLVKERKNWEDAAADAKARGGYLVEIGSEAEQNAVYNGIKSSGISSSYAKASDGGGIAYVWIGATDRAGEGRWLWNGANTVGAGTLFWNDGAAVDGAYHNWGGKAAGSVNEPDNYTEPSVSPAGQNAAAIGLAKWPAGSNTELGRAGEWNDIAEINKIYYVVEFDSFKEN